MRERHRQRETNEKDKIERLIQKETNEKDKIQRLIQRETNEKDKIERQIQRETEWDKQKRSDRETKTKRHGERER